MATAKKKGSEGFLSQLTQVNFYKRNQGRLARQGTALVLGLLVAFGVWTLSQGALLTQATGTRVGVCVGLLAVFGWIIFRVINYPRFADFLIAVESEMDKVTWPSWGEVYRATIVVLVVMLFLGFLLFAYDAIWKWFFELIGFLEKAPVGEN